MNFTPESLHSMVRVSPHTGCWEFMGPKDSHGYGRLFISGKECKAQRVAYELLRWPITTQNSAFAYLIPQQMHRRSLLQSGTYEATGSILRDRFSRKALQ